MWFCNHCPNCNYSSSPHTPCQDFVGSSAKSEGGIVGRIFAECTSIEAQKSSGSLHAHSQLFAQCLHQHTSLRDILQMVRKDGDELVKDYLKYNAWVCRQVYMTPEDQLHSVLIECGKQWPELKEDTHFIPTPNYLLRNDDEIPWIANLPCLSSARTEGEMWFQDYLNKDVDKLQKMKQHRVHMFNPITNQREPLMSCRRTDNPQLCISGSPKQHHLWTELWFHVMVFCELWVCTHLVDVINWELCMVQ